jgi:cytoskeletal protein RodZ
MDSIGAFLRRERELRQISLEELVQQTRVPLRMLQRIEEDRFDDLPGDVFARGFLRSYARALGLPAEQVLARFAQGRKPESQSPPPLLASLQATPERGRRFGIAIALVILVILFTLALSIVFNARHRGTPLELSLRSSTPSAPACAPHAPSARSISTRA